MYGLWINPVARASLTKRSATPGIVAISGRSTLIATFVPITECSASHTDPLPPAPSVEITR